MIRRLLATAVLTACLCQPVAAAEDWGPWEPSTGPVSTTERDELSVLKYGVRFFQKYISPVDGPRCPLTPTCSAYALKAIDKHGPAIGMMMTVDRLFHESDQREHRHPAERDGRIRFSDPVENNDFWFAEK